MTRAVKAGSVPIPIIGMKRPKRAMEGMVWKIPAICKTQLLVLLWILK